MSFGGFGSTNNNNASNTFGGFGASSTGGFGANNASTGGSLFGGNTATSGGGFGGFGATNNNTSNNSPFGAPKPAFGAPAATSGGGGSLFGNNTSTAGGFGSSTFGNTANTGGGFGNNTSGGLFGQNKPATGGFGSNSNGGSLFGGGGGTFGASNNNAAPANNPFGANTNSTFGSSNANAGSGFSFGGASNATNNNSNNNNNGTAAAPFTAFSEKEPASNQTSLYQSITFQSPYSNKSFEELRTEDYAQGRRFGNSNGQAGGFGQSTGFGGFAATNTSTGGSLFGNNAATSGATGFGNTNTNNANSNSNPFGGFGTNNSGSAFGTKPATTSLFGQQSSATATGGFGSTSGGGGSLFGNANTGFGGTNNAAAPATGSLFGANNNQQQNKPAFGGFGATNNNNNTSAFGGSANTGTSLFGGGNTNTAAPAGSSLFGQNNQQQQQSNPFGANTNNSSTSLFGNQNKPATGSLFGSNTNTNTGGSLFGAQNNQQQQSNPFGQPTNTGGSLFGNQNQNKPATSSLFGGNTNTASNPFGAPSNQNSGGGSLFGNNANTGSSLFGNTNKPASSSLFGANNTSNTNSGTSLFGGNQQNNTGSSLFGNANQNQQSSNSMFGGSFGQSQPAQNQLHASLTGAPYGNEQLFSSLAAPSPPVGPLATPLSGARPAPRKTPSLLASARVNTPVYSPRGGSFGRNGGYGFSYSTYGTPGSAYTSGSLTPGASSLLKPTGSLSSALTSRLNKSLSTSNLRGDSTASEGRSLLRPNAFSPEGTPGRYSNGNVRKLKIDRTLRTDLFGPDSRSIDTARDSDVPALRKMVSFENTGEKGSATPEASSSNALVRTEDRDESQLPGSTRAGPSKSQANGKAPEMEQANKTLTTVPEDTEAPRPSTAPGSKTAAETNKRSEIGDYWTKPALRDLKNMSRQQLKNVGNFSVGREGVGRIEFGSVDLTNTPLEDVCGDIVQLNPRSATVYQDDQDKPAMGKALNVPSTIYLENSWPRSHGGRKPVSLKSGKEYDKHIARLKRVSGTHFVKYDPDTGIWCFKVDHFTTYGLDDDDDDASEYLQDSQMMEASSPLSDAPETPLNPQDSTQSLDNNTGEVDDTFEFKLTRRSQLSLPGGFESEGATYDLDEPIVEDVTQEEYVMSGGLGDTDIGDPFMPFGGPVQAPSPATIDRYHSSVMEEEESMNEEDHDIPGSFIDEAKAPKSILKPSATLNMFTSPEKLATQGWEEQLLRTLSPRKRDRQALKDMQQTLMRVREDDNMESPFKQSMLGQSYLVQKSANKAQGMQFQHITSQDLGKSQAFQTAMDLMDSMYASDKTGRKATAGAKGFEYPNPKKLRLTGSGQMSPNDASWHESMKPNFSNDMTLVYSVPTSWPQTSRDLALAIQPLVGEQKDIRFAKFSTAADIDARALLLQKERTPIEVSGGFPLADTPRNILFTSLVKESDTLPHERAIWQLCSILYDPIAIAGAVYVQGIPYDQVGHFEPRMRKDALGAYWADLVAPTVQSVLKGARAAEERALLQLTANDIVGACRTLVDAKDYKLAMLISQLPSTEQSRAMMSNQIEVWRSRHDWSEMSDAVRALYTLLAGELCVVEGKNGAAENRATQFHIAERFGLSWQQSFALRLHFGGFASIVDAIQSYVEDIDTGRERVHPMSGSDAATAQPDGILMDILNLYAGFPESPSLFSQSAASGSSLNWRLSWQLASLLSAKDQCSLSPDELDQITYAFAAQSEAAGQLFSSTWTLLHIQDSQARLAAVASLLERHGDQISTPTEGTRGSFEQLTEDGQIPSDLVWRAKALHAKGGLDAPGLQAEWLLRAGDVEAAHQVLCTDVGPKAVIEQDFALLSNLLEHFEGQAVNGWEQGGQVYLNYLRLVRAHSSHRHIPDEEACVQRLRKGLAAMEDEGIAQKTLEERVAVIEMGKVLEQHGDGGHDQAADGLATTRDVDADMLQTYYQAMAA